jgi:hypothetical protein
LHEWVIEFIPHDRCPASALQQALTQKGQLRASPKRKKEYVFKYSGFMYDMVFPISISGFSKPLREGFSYNFFTSCIT